MDKYVKPEMAKGAVYYFCRCINHEMAAGRAPDVKTALKQLVDNVSHISHKKSDIEPTNGFYTEWEPFIFKRKRIPYKLLYRLSNFYGDAPEKLTKAEILDIYYAVRKEFIECHRFSRDDDKEVEIMRRRDLRELSKLVRDGEYNYTISARSRSFKELFTKDEVEKAAVIFHNMFFTQAVEYEDDSERQAALFLLGVRQGMHTAKSQTYGKTVNVCGNSEPFANLIRKTCSELTGREQMLVYGFAQNLKKKSAAAQRANDTHI